MSIELQEKQPRPINPLADGLLSVTSRAVDTFRGLRNIVHNRKTLSLLLVTSMILAACGSVTPSNTSQSNEPVELSLHLNALQGTVEAPGYDTELDAFIAENPEIANSTYLLTLPTRTGQPTCTGTLVNHDGVHFIVTARHCIGPDIPYIQGTQPHLENATEPIYTTLEGSDVWTNMDSDIIGISVPDKYGGESLEIGPYDPSLPVYFLAFPGTDKSIFKYFGDGLVSTLATNPETQRSRIEIPFPNYTGASGAPIVQYIDTFEPVLVGVISGVTIDQNGNPITIGYPIQDYLNN